jgi:hypothetical protein
MEFTKEQLSDVFVKHLERERGLQIPLTKMTNIQITEFYPKSKVNLILKKQFNQVLSVMHLRVNAQTEHKSSEKSLKIIYGAVKKCVGKNHFLLMIKEFLEK